MNEARTLVNGDPVDTISVLDRGFQYGDGVFETVAVYRETPLLWDRHLARLNRGARRLGIAAPDANVLAAEVARLCSAARAGASIGRAVLKIMLTRGTGSRGYAASATGTPTRVLSLGAWPDYPIEFARSGVSLCVCDTTLSRNPRLAGIKHLNRLEQVLARAEWRMEYADGIMCDDAGNVIEGTMSNIFIVTAGRLRTPATTDCGVDGIMREVVLDAAATLGLPCETGPLTLPDVEHADEMFITNSLIGVWPVRQLRNREYPIGRITHNIQQATRDAHCFDRD